MNVLVLAELDAPQLAALGALLDRNEAATGHPALPEPQRAAVRRRDLGGHGMVALLAVDDGAIRGSAFLSPATDGSTALHVARAPDDAGADIRDALIDRALTETAGAGPLSLWSMRATDADDRDAARHGFLPARDLLQMRVPLPLADEVVAATRNIATRPFGRDHDEELWVATNNRAFAGHPEQGNWTVADLTARLAADWVDLDGFLLADDPAGPGLIGSCWTKIHRHGEPVLGEIYVISVDPDHHGQGWGRSLTVAGLTFMAGRGVRVGMLYTDADNRAAVALYRSLGFRVDHIDRAYARPADLS